MSTCFHPITSVRLMLPVAALFTVCGCARTVYTPDAIVGTATDLPDHFLVGVYDSDETMEPVQDMSCRSPLVDPRDSARLILVTSAGGRGNYEVPEGRYGVGERELLRVDCGTGRALGIVRR